MGISPYLNLANCIAVVVTIVVLAISIRYTFRYLFNINYQQDNQEAFQENDCTAENNFSQLDVDGPGHEGDDELEADEDMEDDTFTSSKPGSFFGRSKFPY